MLAPGQAEPFRDSLHDRVAFGAEGKGKSWVVLGHLARWR